MPYRHSPIARVSGFVVTTTLIVSTLGCANLTKNSVAHKNSDSSQVSYNARLASYDYPFEVKEFDLQSQGQDLKMAYMYIKGKSDKPTVLLLHGKNFSGAYWESTANWLKQRGYSVLIPDQIGFGKSTKPEYYQYSFPQLAHNTMKLADKLNIQNMIVVGHSMGGMLATRLSLMHPKRVKKLILLNPIGLEDYLDYAEYKDIQFFYAQEKDKTSEDIKQYQLKNYYDGRWQPEYDKWVKMHTGWINGPDWKRVAWNNALTYDMIFSQPVANEFDELQVPTTLILGTRDRTGPGRGWKKPGVTYQLGQYHKLGGKVVRQISKGELIELKGLGHMPHIEDFSAFTGALEKAIK